MAYEGVKSVLHLSGKKRKRQRFRPSETVMYLLRKRWTKVERVESFDEVGRTE